MDITALWVVKFGESRPFWRGLVRSWAGVVRVGTRGRLVADWLRGRLAVLAPQSAVAPGEEDEHRRAESEAAAAESLALPIYPELTDEQLRYVAGKIKAFFAR